MKLETRPRGPVLLLVIRLRTGEEGGRMREEVTTFPVHLSHLCTRAGARLAVTGTGKRLKRRRESGG